MFSATTSSGNVSSLTGKKQHPWQDAICKLEDERYSSTGKEGNTSMLNLNRRNTALPPLQPLHQTRATVVAAAPQPTSTPGESSVRIINYANTSRSSRRPRVGIFRSTSPSGSAALESNLDSLEMALQDTSKTSSSTNSTASNSRSPYRSSQRSPARRHSTSSGTNTPVETFEDELAYIHKQSASPKTRSPKYGKLMMEEQDVEDEASPPSRDAWPSGWSPNPSNPFALSNDGTSATSRAMVAVPSAVSTSVASSPMMTSSVSVSSPTSSNPFDDVVDVGDRGNNLLHSNQNPSSSLAKVSEQDSDPNTIPTVASVEDEPQPEPGKNNSNKDNNNNKNISRISGSSGSNSSEEQGYEHGLLHQLCQEATGPNDIAWRNALYLLGMQPELAQQLDAQGRTPLHVSCTGQTTAEENPPRPPPEYMIRALLVANPAAIQQTDADSRLPIHCMAATSGDVDCLQLLVEAHPASIVARDAMGWTPLNLYLQNPHLHITVPPTQVLLGMTLPLQTAASSQPGEKAAEEESASVRQRRGDHLRLNVEHLDRMRQQTPDQLPRWQQIQRCNIPEEILNDYPEDVRVCLQRLAHWERKQHRRQQQQQQKQKEEEEKQQVNKDVSFLSSSFPSSSKSSSSKSAVHEEQERNPAALAAPQDRQLPLHTIILRGLVDVHLQSSRIPEPPKRRRSKQRNNHDPDGMQQKQQHTLIVIVRLLIFSYPEGLIARDANGHTPLLLAMVTASDVLPSQELLELLLGKRTAGYESLPLWAQDVPYPIQHAYTPPSRRRLAPAAERYCNPAIVATLDTCQLPLHIAAEELGDHSSLLVAIYESYPGAIHVQDTRGRMPLHILLHNYRRITPHPEVVAMLLSDRVASTRNDEGQLPFDLLVAAAAYLPKDPIPCSVLASGTVVHPNPYRAFQHFFQPSILASAAITVNGGGYKNILRRRAEAEVFLWRLRALPPWLRRQACSASFVQELLLEELASPGKCAFVLVQGLILILLVASFRRQMDFFLETADNDITPELTSNASVTLPFFEGNGDEILRSSVFAEPTLRYEPWNTLAIYGLSALGIGFQAVFWALSGSLNEFQHLCLFNIWRWVDALAILAAVATAILIHDGVSDEQVLYVAAAATGLLWCSVVGFLSQWWYGMAFLTGSIIKILQMILWPTLLAIICVVGFAEMFYTLAQVDCAEAMGTGSTWICTLQGSYRLVYFLVVGEPVVDIGSAETPSTTMTILMVVFAALSFVLLLSVLVVVVVVASKSDHDEAVALDAYWEPKLALVISSQNSRSAAARYKKEMWIPQPSRMDRFVAQLEETWGVSACLVFGVGKERYWYATNMPSWKKLCWKAVLVIVIPIWLIAGLLTFGALWPPQVRRFLFRPMVGLPAKMKRNEAREFFASQVAGVRNEVLKLKGMSYEQSNDIYQEIQHLKAMIAAALTD